MVEPEALGKFAIFEDLTDRELESVAKVTTIEKRGAGTRIIDEGAPAKSFYLVLDGRVELKMTSPTGQAIKVNEVGPGEVFGWSALFDQTSFTAGVTAIEECRLFVIDGEHLQRLMEMNNHIGYRVTKNIAGVISRRLASLRAALVDQDFTP